MNVRLPCGPLDLAGLPDTAHCAFSDKERLEASARIAAFCARWAPPPAKSPADDLAAIVAAFSVGRAHDREARLLEHLASRYPGAVTMDELYDALLPPSAPEVAAKAVRKLISAVNSDLDRLEANRLRGFTITTLEAARQGSDVVVTLRPLASVNLLQRSLGDAWVDPKLRVAWGIYDSGDHAKASRDFLAVLERLPNRLSVAEIALCFYHFSKSLLKLNWSDELELILDGPYRRLSEALDDALEPERLQIKGILARQGGKLAEAFTCLDAAVARLTELAAAGEVPAATWRLLADAEVLQAQARIDQAVGVDRSRSGRDPLVRREALRFAEGALRRAHQHFDHYRPLSRTPSHYEGRLAGTTAFVTVAKSLIDPEKVVPAMWASAAEHARKGFEPRARKPFGVVAGRYALAVVLIAEALWRRAREGDAEVAARKLEEARAELKELVDGYLASGQVQLGPEFELPKVAGAIAAIDALRANSATHEHVPAAVFTPLV
jgi:tetratricopeptide (TPR) repeat protein